MPALLSPAAVAPPVLLSPAAVAPAEAAQERFESLLGEIKASVADRGFTKAREALEFAQRYHMGKRKDGVTPEFQHQMEIALHLSRLKGVLEEEKALAAAMFHDVLEDYDVDRAEEETERDILPMLRSARANVPAQAAAYRALEETLESLTSPTAAPRGQAPAANASLKDRLRAVQLVPTSPKAVRAGLAQHLQIVGESLRDGLWPEVRAESETKISLLIGMLEYLQKALAKDVALCTKCVSNRSCSKVDGGKGCSGCLSSVKMSADEVESALRTARSISAHLKEPTIAGVNGCINELSRAANAGSADRAKWDSRYGSLDYAPGKEPVRFLAEIAHLLPREGRALDLAMGAGRNGVFLAQRGLDVLGLDISEEGLKRARSLAFEKGVVIRAETADLDSRDLEKSSYDVILSILYFNRRLLPQIKDALKPGGWAVFEVLASHLEGKDELLNAFKDFEIVRYETRNEGKSVVILLARKRPRRNESLQAAREGFF